MEDEEKVTSKGSEIKIILKRQRYLDESLDIVSKQFNECQRQHMIFFHHIITVLHDKHNTELI